MKVGEQCASEFNALSITFDKVTINNLRKFLLERESDIASSYEDLGLLKEIFLSIIGRESWDI